MSPEENKSIVRRLYDAQNQNYLAAIDALISPTFMVYLPGFPQPLYGPEGVKRSMSMYRAAFPDLFITIKEQIAEGDKVVVMWTSQGTNLGPMMGMPPTGQRMMFAGIDVWRLADGKVVETFGLQQPIGTPPPMSQF
ncbi:MAG TPA: ester cyclase [Ktedonobacteraceae bacterium]|nr:ester cyclase [Ktedonobacteraceae bacterium]